MPFVILVHVPICWFFVHVVSCPSIIVALSYYFVVVTTQYALLCFTSSVTDVVYKLYILRVFSCSYAGERCWICANKVS